MQSGWPSFEARADTGLNGAMVLIHPGTDPARTDKFYLRLGEMIDYLYQTKDIHLKGYKSMAAQSKTRSPWAWIPSLYLAEGLPYVAVNIISVIMYKRMGISNADIALYTSLLYLPWVIKPIWSPLVDLLKTKRWWIVITQLVLALGFASIALTIPASLFFKITLAFFWLLAFGSATHDIAADGFYMLGLNTNQQAKYVGIRSTFYRVATITGQGLLVILAGFLESSSGREPCRALHRGISRLLQNCSRDASRCSSTGEQG
ncbi:MAG: hypothetical protein MZV63_21305 [Marinilabiliales bacterium]|nr:hypothetical protein [Marinilabiliales bacterium]